MGPPVGRSVLWKCLTTWYVIAPRTGHHRETSCPRHVSGHVPEGKVESLYNFSSVEHSSMKKLLQNSMQLQ